MYFILGQGLAGTCLGLRFLKQGIPFKIFDDSHKSSSSIVAAGLWNPIVFKRITTSWLAQEVIDELEFFYSTVESTLGVKFFFPGFNIRLHSSQHERNEWLEKRTTPRLKNFLSLPAKEEMPNIENPYGFGKINHTGHIDLFEFLNSSKSYFLKSKVYEEIAIHLPDSIQDLSNFSHKGVNPKKIIDCRGVQSAHSQWWSFLPFKLSKGEMLVVRCLELDLRHTLNAGVFVMPLGDHLFKIGSTYSWENLNAIPTEAGKQELVEKFKKVTSSPFEIVDHSAGIRPTVSDRRPLIGTHPDINKLLIFNGLGTKGVLLAPYFSKVVVDYLLNDLPILPEANIARFFRK